MEAQRTDSASARHQTTYCTAGGFTVHRSEQSLATEAPGMRDAEGAKASSRCGEEAIEELARALDQERGAVFASSYEVPGRYARWDRGFKNPPLCIEARGRRLSIRALNARGQILLPGVLDALAGGPLVTWIDRSDDQEIELHVPTQRGSFSEEERSRQPSVFSVLRAVVSMFQPIALGAGEPGGEAPDDELGLHGAFGYDLAFQFEPIRPFRTREAEQRDLVLYLADELVVVDHRLETSARIRYDFEYAGTSTCGLPREGTREPYRAGELARGSDHEHGEYAQVVRRARSAFARGDLFEVVPGQVFSEACPALPSEVFGRLRERNPSPYGFLMNLGSREYLVGASPEMYVRVTNAGPPGTPPRRVETCPISGTIARGADPIGDAAQIRDLLNSSKDECELTMCTDVDRNDKSRVCEPESIRVLARRQIEMYSRLIHTVDHVEGMLATGFDALDAFLAHAWAVTVTGAPKRAAMQFIEEHELSPRRFYGGAIGTIGFDGTLNTGLVLRTIRIADGNAEVRAGATLLYDSDPDAEEQETELKASALLDALRTPEAKARRPAFDSRGVRAGAGKRVLIVDAQDSFVHTLGGYFRRAGAKVKTLRAGFPMEDLARYEPDLVVLSPGPGRPEDFALARVLAAAIAEELPVFGVCLGLQAIVEACGGELGQLPAPVHGKASEICTHGGVLFRGFPPKFRAGRYHSLYARAETLTPEVIVTATDGDGVVMAIEHATLPLSGVQFHPESILTQTDGLGMRLISNVLSELAVRPRQRISREVLSI